ncbi:MULTISPECIES: acyl-CoA dehydrogenase family protein [unclassified Mycobacterium]|uniref:acyl-CoA dehydrogenase family protein n=1 Tax=unclassified Mycobacterium TaxID=2642494 RepID=UPI0029C62F57|nr:MULTISPECIES: acyl-CoA dehydrogenase family protein [unclassified Mycobacterium]
MDGDSLTDVRATLRHLFASEPPDLISALADLGWQEIVRDDPATATSALFEEQGRQRATSAALDSVVLAQVDELPATTVVWPHPDDGDRPSSWLADDETVVISGLALRAPDASVAVPTESGLVTADTGTLLVRHLDGIDPTAGWVNVSGRATVVAVHPCSWADTVSAAQRALASEIVGVSQATLAMAVEHVSARTQFGRAIGSFQSVRHRLAEAYTAIAAAEAVIKAAWEWPTPWASAAAKAIAGRAHSDTARHAMQVCGGMGLSWEYDLHRYVRRGYALDALLGSASVIARKQGTALATGTNPLPVGGILPPTAPPR